MRTTIRGLVSNLKLEYEAVIRFRFDNTEGGDQGDSRVVR